MDLSTLREKDIKTFPLDKTLEVVQSLKAIEPLKLSKVEALEKIGDYRLYTSIILKRIENGEFEETNTEAKYDNESLLAELKKLLDDFTFSFEINQFVKNQTSQIKEQITSIIKEVERQKEKLNEELEKQKKEIEETVRTEKAKIEEQSQQVDKKISDTEHNILSHVLTLMGIFSAVTTIIMSVVITSSSWLNNADGASAVFAFAIPNLVVLISIVVLMLLIVLYNSVEKAHRKEQVNVASIIIIAVVLAIIIILSALMVEIAVSYTSPGENLHTRYVITPSEYRVIADESNELSYDIGNQRYLEFNFGGIDYRFIYDEKYIHNGNLYYCGKHSQLE